MDCIFNFFKGIVLGAGFILPGISSGVICVIFGMYEKLIDSILNIFHDFKKNFRYLFPIALGGILGIVIFGNILNYIFSNFQKNFNLTVFVLILISIPSIMKKANSNRFKVRYLLYTLITFVISILFILVESNFNLFLNFDSTNFSFLIFSGFLMSIGMVIPGVSSTVILILLGIYNVYLNSISTFNLCFLIPLGIGIFLGCIVFLCIINFCMKNFYMQTMYSIVGFILGSTLILLPSNFSIIDFIFIICEFLIYFTLKKLFSNFSIFYKLPKSS